MLNLIRENRWYFLCAVIFITGGAILLYLQEHGRMVIFFNTLHNNIADYFFQYITELGSFTSYLTFIILLLFIRYFYALAGFVVSAITAFTGQFFKRMVYPEIPRPIIFFKDKKPLIDFEHVTDVFLHTFYSFPSGHTITAFTIFTLLAFFFKNKNLGVLFFFIALLVGFSRIYLFQHFFRDIYAGAVIAIFLTTLFYYLLIKFVPINEHEHLKGSLADYIKKKFNSES